jgi:4-hydroxy-3-methylbut-2-enyl diphosphate reductase IspH
MSCKFLPQLVSGAGHQGVAVSAAFQDAGVDAAGASSPEIVIGQVLERLATFLR